MGGQLSQEFYNSSLRLMSNSSTSNTNAAFAVKKNIEQADWICNIIYFYDNI